MSAKEGNLYPSMIWMDFRAGDEAAAINYAIGEAMGIPDLEIVNAKDVLPKMIWIREHMPEVWSRTDALLTDTGYMVWRATGNFTMSKQNAINFGQSGKTKDWDFSLTDALGVSRELFPAILDSAEAAGTLTEKAAEELGLPAGIPVATGFSDASAAEIGAGCIEDGEAAAYFGTSMIFTMITSDDNEHSASAYAYPAVNPEYRMYMSTNDFAGGCIDWIAEKLYEPSKGNMTLEECYADMDRQLDATDPGAERMIFNSFMYGERQPINDSNVRGVLWNMNPDHGREHILRAVYEGIAQEFRWTLEEFAKEHGHTFTRLKVSGGCTASSRLMQIISDITGLTLDVIEDGDQAVAKGTGYCAFMAAGLADFDDVRQMVRIRATYAPREEYKELYDRQAYFYQKLYFAMKDLYAELNGDI